MSDKIDFLEKVIEKLKGQKEHNIHSISISTDKDEREVEITITLINQ